MLRRMQTPTDYDHAAKLAFGQGDVDRALALTAEALERFPGDPVAIQTRVGLLSVVGMGKEALKLMDELILARGDGEAWFLKGRLLQDLGRLGEAADAYRAATERSPDYVDAWVNLGCVLDDAGKHAEALAPYGVAIGLDPTEAMALCNRGNSLMALGRYEEAAKSYRAAAELEYDGAGTQLRRALAYAGDLAGANDPDFHDEAVLGEARERTATIADTKVVARYFTGRHSHPQLMDAVVEGLLDFVDAMAEDHDGNIGAGSRIQFGLSRLTLRDAGDGGLIVCETDWNRDADALRPEVTMSAQLLVQMRVLHDSVDADPEDCSLHQEASVDMGAFESEQFTWERFPTNNSSHSGWQLRPAERAAGDTESVELGRLAAANLGLVRALTLPVGWSATFEGHQILSVKDPEGNERLPAPEAQ